MRLENYSVAAFEALEADDTLLDTAPPAAPVELPPAPVAEAPSTRLSDMARQPPLDMPLPVELPRAHLPRIVDGDGPRRPPSREGFQSFDTPTDGGDLAGDAPLPVEAPAPVAAAPAPVPATPVAAPAPAATPAAITPAPVPAPDAVPPVALTLPQGDVVNPAWLATRETAVQALHTDIEAARAVARSAPPADVAAAPGTGWVAAPTDGDGNPVAGSVFVPDAAAAAAAPAVLPAWMMRDGAAPAPAGQWLSFDDGAFEQAYRERLAAQPQASTPLNRLAQLYGQPPAALLGAHPEVWTLATQPHAINAGAPPVADLAMGDAAALGQLDLYLADPFISQLRTQLGGTPAAPTSSVALEQQRLYGPARYAELTQLSQALAAVRQTHATAMQAARDGGGPGWVEMPLQFGTAPETGWPTGQYVTTGDGEILRDANGMPVIATQRVFDEARFTNAWLAEGAQTGGLAQQAFASFYGQAQSHLSLQQDQSENAGPPRWVSQPGLDNPHVGLGDAGVLDGDLITLDLNRPPRLNDDAAVGFDLQLGWVTGRGNLHEHRSFLDKALPIVITVMAAYAGGVVGGQLLGGTFGTTIGTGIGAGTAGAVASGILNGDLSFKGVLRGALSGALTAGLTQALGPITQSLANAGLGGAASVLTRMTVGGAVQSLLGGSFKQGALSGLGAGLAQAVGDAIAKGISDGALQGADKFAAQAASRVIASALRALTTPGDPGQAFASDLLSTLINDGLSEAQKQQAAQEAQALQQAVQPGTATSTDGDGVQTFPVPAQPPATATPLPPTLPDLSAITPRPGESDSEFTVRLMREIYGPNLDLTPAGEHNQYQIYRDEKGQLVVSDGTGLNRPIDPKVSAAFEAMLAQRMQQLNAMAAVQRSQAFSEWAAANSRPVASPSEPGLWNQRIPVVADVRDFLLSQIDRAIGTTQGSGQVALEGLRIAVEAIAPETYGDAALNELGAGIIKAGLPLAGVLKAAAVESRLGKELSELLQVASREGGDVTGHLVGNAAEAEAREAGRLVIRETPGKKAEWNAALNAELKPNATYVLTNGHSYTTDALGRVTKAEGTLTPATVDRNAYQQLLAGRAGGEGYDGGHLIGTMLGGAGERINLVAQLSSINRGEFRVMEKSWAEAIQAGKNVRVEVSPAYSGTGQVPASIEVRYWIDGVLKERSFPNGKG